MVPRASVRSGSAPARQESPARCRSVHASNRTLFACAAPPTLPTISRYHLSMTPAGQGKSPTTPTETPHHDIRCNAVARRRRRQVRAACKVWFPNTRGAVTYRAVRKVWQCGRWRGACADVLQVVGRFRRKYSGTRVTSLPPHHSSSCAKYPTAIPPSPRRLFGFGGLKCARRGKWCCSASVITAQVAGRRLDVADIMFECRRVPFHHDERRRSSR